MKGQGLPCWHVDAFADRPFTGNPAAVILLDGWLPDPLLQAIGEENNLPATAFVVPDATGEAEWELRWFTPSRELRLCGHATLASGHVLLGSASHAGGNRVTFRTRQAGVLTVQRRPGGGYELALPAIPTAPRGWPEATALLGDDPLEVWRSPDRYSVFLFGSEAQVRALAPDLRGLAGLGDDQFICTAPGVATDVVSRVFVPGAGIDEDSVTGSAHAALTPYWAARLGRDRFTAHQASARGGNLDCFLDGAQAWIGGSCVTVVEGTLYVSG